MAVAKFKGYQDVERKIILASDIADLLPYEVKLPSPPKPEEIINFGLPFEEQFFKRIKLPRKLLAIDEKTKILGKEGIDSLVKARAELEADPELCSFVEMLWMKRALGEWQYIRGIPTYITGDHWFYLNFYYLYGYYPDYRQTDREEFYWWRFCVEENPKVYGGIWFTRRQVGKTLRAGSMLLNYVTSGSFKHLGIQSKTDVDAASLFRKAIAPQFKRLPFFFKPYFDPQGGMKKRLDLTNDEHESLDSWIDFRASVDTAYDGETLDRYLVDECGKMKLPADPVQMWDKVKPAFMQDGRIRGKALFCTTVSELESGGGAFKNIWDASNRAKLNELGQTESGLVPYFCPAYKNIFFDQYGASIIEKPLPYQLEWRKRRKDEYASMGGREYIDKLIEGKKKELDKQKEIRKYPRNIREAFKSANTFCHFDLGILTDRDKYFTFGYEGTKEAKLMKFGNFHWKDSVFGSEVEFIEVPIEQCDEARFWISYLPDEKLRNRFTIHPVTTKRVPANWQKFAAGADPFKFDTEDVIHKDRMSDGAMTIYAEYDITVDTPDKRPEDYITGDMCVEYLWRADTVDEMCEDFLKAAVFYGTKVFPEKNNRDVVGYFKRTGFEHYLQFDMEIKRTQEGTYLAEKSAGSNTDVKSIQSMFKVVQKYVKDNGLRCKFYRTIRHLLHVSPDNMSPFDLFVSLATCMRVVGEFNPIRLATEEAEEDVGDISDVLAPRDYMSSGYSESNGGYDYNPN